MHFGPILAALHRHRTAAALIILEIALSCAIVSNAVYLIGERMNRMQRPSGIAESELVRLLVTGFGRSGEAHPQAQEDLAMLAAIPGVRKVVATRQLPFGDSSWNTNMKVSPDPTEESRMNVSTYLGSDGLLETLGLKLAAGRDFEREEYVDEDEALATVTTTRPIIITSAVAERLWPGQSGLGQIAYMGRYSVRVVGVLERLIRPDEFHGPTNFEFSVLLPLRPKLKPIENYVLRTDPERRDEVLAAAAAAIESRPGRIIIEKQTLEELRTKYYQTDRAMAWLLVSVCAALLIITALGIVGLASFWVQQRTRQIGIRRALGATRGQIVRYFQIENFLLATLGIALGMLLAYGINQLLMERYELGRLPAQFLPIGALSLWVLGQLAVLGPALRAASVPPAVATRTV
jgi:putative ABC transport system permease protein